MYHTKMRSMMLSGDGDGFKLRRPRPRPLFLAVKEKKIVEEDRGSISFPLPLFLSHSHTQAAIGLFRATVPFLAGCCCCCWGSVLCKLSVYESEGLDDSLIIISKNTVTSRYHRLVRFWCCTDWGTILNDHVTREIYIYLYIFIHIERHQLTD